MKWNEVSKITPPKPEERVLVWIKYDGEPDFEWVDSEIIPEIYVAEHDYREPITGKCWMMGSARNYVITHFMYIDSPK